MISDVTLVIEDVMYQLRKVDTKNNSCRGVERMSILNCYETSINKNPWIAKFIKV